MGLSLRRIAAEVIPVLSPRLPIVVSLSWAVCLLAPPARGQLTRSSAPSARPPVSASLPRGCPAPASVARAISPGDVSLASLPAGSSAAETHDRSRTVFYGVPSGVSATDTGGRHRDSARLRKPNPVRTGSTGDIVAGRSTATISTSAKRTPLRALPAVRRRRFWTVQVAAYETLDEALAMQEMLCARGYEARILGAGRPYDVRVGRYPTSDSALAVARHLMSRQLTVFVTPE